MVQSDGREKVSQGQVKGTYSEGKPEESPNVGCKKEGLTAKNESLRKRRKQKKHRASPSRSPPRLQRHKSSNHPPEVVVNDIEKFLKKRSKSTADEFNKAGGKLDLAIFIGDEYQQHKADEKNIFQRVREKNCTKASNSRKAIHNDNTLNFFIPATNKGVKSGIISGTNQATNISKIDCDKELNSSQTEAHMFATPYHSNQTKSMPQINNVNNCVHCVHENTDSAKPSCQNDINLNIDKALNINTDDKREISTKAKSLIEGPILYSDPSEPKKKIEVKGDKESRMKGYESESNEIFVNNNESNRHASLSDGDAKLNSRQNEDFLHASNTGEQKEDTMTEISFPASERIFQDRKNNYIPSPEKLARSSSVDVQDPKKETLLSKHKGEELVGQESEIILGPSFPEINTIFSSRRHDNLPIAVKPLKIKDKKHKSVDNKPDGDMSDSVVNQQIEESFASSPTQSKRKKKKKAKKYQTICKSSSNESVGQKQTRKFKKIKEKPPKRSQTRSCSESDRNRSESNTRSGKNSKDSKLKHCSSTSSAASDVCSMTPHNMHVDILKTHIRKNSELSEEAALEAALDIITKDKISWRAKSEDDDNNANSPNRPLHSQTKSDRSLTPKPRSPTPKPRSPTPKPRSPTPKPRSPTPKPRSPTPKPCIRNSHSLSEIDNESIVNDPSDEAISQSTFFENNNRAPDGIKLNKPKKKHKKKKSSRITSSADITIDCFSSKSISSENSSPTRLSESGNPLLTPPILIDTGKPDVIGTEKSSLCSSQSKCSQISQYKSRQNSQSRSPSPLRKNSQKQFSKWSPGRKKGKTGRSKKKSPEYTTHSPRNRSEGGQKRKCPDPLKPPCRACRKDCEEETRANDAAGSPGAQQKRRAHSSEGFFGKMSKGFGGLLAQIASNHNKYRFPSRRDLFVPDIGMGKCWMFPPKGEPEMGLFEVSRRLARHPDMEVSEDDTSLQVSDSLGESHVKTKQKTSAKSKAKALNSGKKDSHGNYKVEIGYPNEKYVLTVTQDENCSPTFIPYEDGAQDAELISCRETDDGTEWKFRIPSVNGDGDDGQEDSRAAPCNFQKTGTPRRESTSKRERASKQGSFSRRTSYSRQQRPIRHGSISGRSTDDYSGRSSRLYRHRRSGDVSETSASNVPRRYRRRSSMSSCTSLGDRSLNRRFDTTGYTTEDDHIVQHSYTTETDDGKFNRIQEERTSHSNEPKKKKLHCIDLNRSYSNTSMSSVRIAVKNIMPAHKQSSSDSLMGYKKHKRSYDDSDVECYSKRSKKNTPSRRRSLETLDDSCKHMKKYIGTDGDRSYRDEESHRDAKISRGKYSDHDSYHHSCRSERRQRRHSQRDIECSEDSWHQRRVSNTSRSNRKGYRFDRDNSIDKFENLNYYYQPKYRLRDTTDRKQRPRFHNDTKRSGKDMCVQRNREATFNNRRAYSSSPKKTNYVRLDKLGNSDEMTYNTRRKHDNSKILFETETGKKDGNYRKVKTHNVSIKDVMRKASLSPCKYCLYSGRSIEKRKQVKMSKKYKETNCIRGNMTLSKRQRSSPVKGSKEFSDSDDYDTLRNDEVPPFKENEILALKREIDHLSDISETLLNLGRCKRYGLTNSQIKSPTHKHTSSLEIQPTGNHCESTFSHNLTSHDSRASKKRYSPSDTVSLQRCERSKEEVICHSAKKKLQDEISNKSICSGSTSCSDHLSSDGSLIEEKYERLNDGFHPDRDNIKKIQHQDEHQGGGHYLNDTHAKQTKSDNTSEYINDREPDKNKANLSKLTDIYHDVKSNSEALLKHKNFIQSKKIDNLGQLFTPEKTLAFEKCKSDDACKANNIVTLYDKCWSYPSTSNILGGDVITAKPPIYYQCPKKQRNDGATRFIKSSEKANAFDEHGNYIMVDSYPTTNKTSGDYKEKIDSMQMKIITKKSTSSPDESCKDQANKYPFPADRLFYNGSENSKSIFFDDDEYGDFCSSTLSLSKNQNSSSSVSMSNNHSVTKDIFYPQCLCNTVPLASSKRDSYLFQSSSHLDESFPVRSRLLSKLLNVPASNNPEAGSNKQSPWLSTIRPGGGDAFDIDGKKKDVATTYPDIIATNEFGTNCQNCLYRTSTAKHVDVENRKNDVDNSKTFPRSKPPNEIYKVQKRRKNIDETKSISETEIAKPQVHLLNDLRKRMVHRRDNHLWRSKSESPARKKISQFEMKRRCYSLVFRDSVTALKNIERHKYTKKCQNDCANPLLLPESVEYRSHHLRYSNSATVIEENPKEANTASIIQFADTVIKANKKTLAFERSRFKQNQPNHKTHETDFVIVSQTICDSFCETCHSYCNANKVQQDTECSKEQTHLQLSQCSNHDTLGFRYEDTTLCLNNPRDIVCSISPLLHQSCRRSNLTTSSLSKANLPEFISHTRNKKEIVSSNSDTHVRAQRSQTDKDVTDQMKENGEALKPFVILKSHNPDCVERNRSVTTHHSLLNAETVPTKDVRSTENATTSIVNGDDTMVLHKSKVKNIVHGPSENVPFVVDNQLETNNELDEAYISTLFADRNNTLLHQNFKIIFDPVNKAWLRPKSQKNVPIINPMGTYSETKLNVNSDLLKDENELNRTENSADADQVKITTFESLYDNNLNQSLTCRYSNPDEDVNGLLIENKEVDSVPSNISSALHMNNEALESLTEFELYKNNKTVSSIVDAAVHETLRESLLGSPSSPVPLSDCEASCQVNNDRTSGPNDLCHHSSAPCRIESDGLTCYKARSEEYDQLLQFQSMITKEMKGYENKSCLAFNALLYWLSRIPDSNNSSIGIDYPMNKNTSWSDSENYGKDKAFKRKVSIRHRKDRLVGKKKRSHRSLQRDVSVQASSSDSLARHALQNSQHKLSNKDLYNMYIEQKHNGKSKIDLLSYMHSNDSSPHLATSFSSTGFGKLTTVSVDTIALDEKDMEWEYIDLPHTFTRTSLTPIQEESSSSIEQTKEERRSILQNLFEAFMKTVKNTGDITGENADNMKSESSDENVEQADKSNRNAKHELQVEHENEIGARSNAYGFRSNSTDSFTKSAHQHSAINPRKGVVSLQQTEQNNVTNDLGHEQNQYDLKQKNAFSDYGTHLFPSLYDEKSFRSSFMKNDIRSHTTLKPLSLSTTEGLSQTSYHAKRQGEPLSFLDRSRNRFIETQRFLSEHSEIASSKYRITPDSHNRHETSRSSTKLSKSKGTLNVRQTFPNSTGTFNNSSANYRYSTYDHLSSKSELASLPYNVHTKRSKSPFFIGMEKNASFSNNKRQYGSNLCMFRAGSSELANWNSNESANNGEDADHTYQGINPSKNMWRQQKKQKPCKISRQSDAHSFSSIDLTCAHSGNCMSVEDCISSCQHCSQDQDHHESCDEINHTELIHQYVKSNKLAVFAGRNINGSGNLVGTLPHYTQMSKSLGYPIEAEELGEGSEDEYPTTSDAHCKIDPFGCSTISSGGIVSVLATGAQEIDATCNHPSSSIRFIGDGSFGPTGDISRDDILMKMSPCCSQPSSQKMTSARNRQDYKEGQKYNYSDAFRTMNPNVGGNSSYAIQRHGIDMRQSFCGQGDSNSKRGFTEWYVDDQTAHAVPVTGINIDLDASSLSAKWIQRSSADRKSACHSSEGSPESMNSLSTSSSARVIVRVDQCHEPESEMSLSKVESDFDLDQAREDNMVEDDDDNDGNEEVGDSEDDGEWEDEEEDEEEMGGEENVSLCRRLTLARAIECRNASSMGMSLVANQNFDQDTCLVSPSDEHNVTQNKHESTSKHGPLVCMKYADKTNDFRAQTICNKIDGENVSNLHIRSRHGEAKNIDHKRPRHRTKSTSTVSKKFSIDQIQVPSIDKERVRFACNESGEWAEIGRGSYGCVYLGLLDGKVEVAIKDFYESSSWDLVIHEARMLLFLQETGITPTLYGLRRRFDVTKEPSEYCIIMEYFGDGRTLFNVMSDKVPLLPEEWLDVVGQLVAGLRLIHSKNVLINDLKADNILIDLSEGRKTIRYIDVGMATYKHGLTFQLPQDQMNRYNFLAPEVREGSHTSYKSDIYSLGYMLQQISRLAGSTLSGLDKLIAQCTDKNPANRPDIDQIVSQVHWYIMSKSRFGSASSDGNVFLSKSV